jgi:hypothetical protein
MGLKGEKRFGKYHRVLSRARGSGLAGARMLLGLWVALLPAGWPILMGIDETIERRKGPKLKAKGVYRDAVRSTEKPGVKCLGLKGRIHKLGEARSNRDSKRSLVQARRKCSRWLRPDSLQRMPTPLKRCWMSHLHALSTQPLPIGSPSRR